MTDEKKGDKGHHEGVIRCSFCHKSQDEVGKLISSPSDYPRAYMCDECVAVCNSILEDDRQLGDLKKRNREPKNSGNPATTIFYSYSHRDEHLRTKLEEHLSILKWQGLLTTWHDRKIQPGQAWETAIDNQLESADIVLLLVSSSFLAFDYF